MDCWYFKWENPNEPLSLTRYSTHRYERASDGLDEDLLKAGLIYNSTHQGNTFKVWEHKMVKI